MISWITANLLWIKLAGVAVLLSAASLSAWHIRGLEDEKRFIQEIANQKSADQLECDKAKAITQKANDAIQKNTSDVDAEFNSLYDATRCMPTTRTAKRDDIPTRLPATYGQNSFALYDLARDAEKDRRTAITLKTFIEDERK